MGIPSALDILQNILPFVKAHGIMVSLLGGFITGEAVIISLAFLSGAGVLPVWYLLVFCTIGMYFSDFVPFTIGRFRFFRNLLEKEKFVRHVERLEDLLRKYTRNNLFLILMYTKVIYGASIPALVYLGSKKTPYSKFAIYNIFVEIIFVPIVVLVGWLAGRGFNVVTTIFDDIRIGIFLLLVFVVILYFVRKWMNKELIVAPKQLK